MCNRDNYLSAPLEWVSTKLICQLRFIYRVDIEITVKWTCWVTAQRSVLTWYSRAHYLGRLPARRGSLLILQGQRKKESQHHKLYILENTTGRKHDHGRRNTKAISNTYGEMMLNTTDSPCKRPKSLWASVSCFRCSSMEIWPRKMKKNVQIDR